MYDMKKYDIIGMHCAGCAAKVENAVKKLKGVKSCSVNLLSASMTVEGKVDDKAIINAVKNAGFSASAADKKNIINKNNFILEKEKIKKRLIVSIIFLIPLMYICFGISNIWPDRKSVV